MTLLTQRDAALYLHLSERTLERMRVAGNGPRFVRLSNRSIRYRQQDLDAHVAARVVASTSQLRAQEEFSNA